jgi:drug/metabolite transporter (DMT)-like permease
MKPKDAAALLALSTIWGSAFLFIHVAVREVSPFTVVAVRLAIAALVVAPLAARSGATMPARAAWPVLLFLAAFNNVVPFTLITAAQEHITSSLAATLVATMPLFVLIFAYVSATERLNVERIAGLIIGFVGVAVLIGTDITDITNSNTVGELAVIAATASYALSTVVARRWSTGAPLSLASAQMIFGACMAIPLALLIDGSPDLAVSAKAGLSLVALGALCSGLAYIIFFTLVQRMEATQLSLVSYVIPIVATVLGWLVLNEPLGPNLFAGLVLVVIGAVGVNGGLHAAWRWSRNRSARGGAAVGPGGAA